MIEPTLALQTAVRSALINSPEVTALVDANSIISGDSRPGDLPSIKLAGVATRNLGYAAGSQYAAQCLLDIHIWAEDDGRDAAWQIGFAVCQALRDAPAADGFFIVEWEKPTVRWMRDPDPNRTLSHGIISLEAVIQWRL